MEPIFEKRKTTQVIVKKPDIESLKFFAELLPDEQRGDFKKKYGKILELLTVNVQVGALYCLTQFYDPEYRCFTFQDFQLVPTLEEFSQILGYPLTDKKPYHYVGHQYTWKTVAGLLQVKLSDLEGAKEKQGTTIGIKRQYLENMMGALADNGEWKRFMDVLALTIYGLVLFPSAENVISFAAIGVFYNYKNELKENPVPAVLADVFYTLNLCRTKNRKRLLCCQSALYVWITSYIFKRGYEPCCPIRDFRSLYLQPQTDKQWVKIFTDLKAEEVRWYPKWKNVTKVLYHCGDFPNVPLVGTMGCINYNPSLALRQLAYPMFGEPPKESYEPFIAELDNVQMLKRIRNAWGEVVFKDKELGRRACWTDALYKEWVRNRVTQIKLPFQHSRDQEDATTTSEESDEVKELKMKLAKVEAEKITVEDELLKVNQAFKNLQYENREKIREFEELKERALFVKKNYERTSADLRAANKELGHRNAEKRKVVSANHRLMEAQGKMRKSLNTLKAQVSEEASLRMKDKQAFEKEIMECHKQLQKKQEELEELKRGREYNVMEENK